MGSHETPIHSLVVNEIVFTDQAGVSGVVLRNRVAGTLVLSGVKLYIDDGTDLNLISSA